MSKNLIYNKQFGFRKNHSTGHAINYSVNKIISELQQRNHVIGIFMIFIHLITVNLLLNLNNMV